MVLDTEDGGFAVAHAFDGAVVEVDMRDLHIAREAGGVDGKTMVLAGDRDTAITQVFDGLIATPVAKFQLKGAAAVGVAEDLVAEANGEDGLFADELTDLLVDVLECRRISGAIGEKNTIRIPGEDLLRRGGGGDDIDAEARLAQGAQDVALDAEIVGDDVTRRWRELMKSTRSTAFTLLGGAGNVPGTAFGAFRVPEIGRLGADLFDIIAASHGRAAGGQLDGLVRIEDATRDDRTHRSPSA